VCVCVCACVCVVCRCFVWCVRGHGHVCENVSVLGCVSDGV